MPTFHTFLRGLLILTLHLHAIPPGTGAAARDDDDTLMPGQAFTVGNKLVSSNGKFALGFFQPSAGNMSKPSSSTSPAGWYLGIWFNKIPPSLHSRLGRQPGAANPGALSKCNAAPDLSRWQPACHRLKQRHHHTNTIRRHLVHPHSKSQQHGNLQSHPQEQWKPCHRIIRKLLQ